MWPQVVIVIATVVSRIASYKEKHHINVAIAIAVIVVVVNILISSHQRVREDDITIVGALRISTGIGHVHGSHNVKYRVKDVVGVIIVIISHTTCHRHKTTIEPVAGEIMGVNHVVIEAVGIVHRELLVGVIDEDDETAKLVIVHHTLGAHAVHGSIAAPLHLRAGTHLGRIGQTLGD